MEDDADRRLQRCEFFISRFKDNPELFNEIMWSDEASFKLNGMINPHKCVIYATENPHLTYDKQLNQPGITVWAALSSDGLLGSYFFDETVIGNKYFEMLNERLRDRPDFNNLLFMQDGAPTHYAKKIRDL